MNEAFDIGGVSFMNSYSDFQRSGQSAIAGSVIKGGKYEAVSKLMYRISLTPKDRFIEAVQTACREEETAFPEMIVRAIAERHPHPDYLNGKLCLFAIQECIQNVRVDKDKFIDPRFQERMAEKDIDLMDLYRYSTMISLLLQNK